MSLFVAALVMTDTLIFNLKQGQTVHKLPIYRYIHLLLVCVICADLPTASKNANGYGD